MTTKNAVLIGDAFNVMGIVEIRLPGPWWWHGADIEEEHANGVIFRAYRDSGGLDIAYVLVADVTSDPTEPEIAGVSPADVPELDRYLEAGARKEIEARGFRISRWMSSHLNESCNKKGLVTAYVTTDSGKDRQMIALRMSIHNRKMIFIGCFDVAEASILASAVFGTLQQIRVLRRAM